MRLIDADRLKEHFSWWTNPDGTDTEQKKLFNEIIDKQPTACSNNAIGHAFHEGFKAGLDVVNHISGLTYKEKTDEQQGYSEN